MAKGLIKLFPFFLSPMEAFDLGCYAVKWVHVFGLYFVIEQHPSRLRICFITKNIVNEFYDGVCK